MTREKNIMMSVFLAAGAALFVVAPPGALGQTTPGTGGETTIETTPETGVETPPPPAAEQPAPPETVQPAPPEAPPAVEETVEPAQTLTADEKNLLGKLEKFTKTEKLTLEGKAFLRYWYDVQDSSVEGPGEEEPHLNSFELWRFYFGIRAQLAKWLTMRFTTDVGPEKDQTAAEAGEHVHGDMPESEADGAHTHKVPGDQSYELFVKFAWFNVEPVKGLNIRAGLLEFPMHEFIDNFWGYRYVAKNAGDESKVWNTADLGAYIKYLIPRNFGDITIGIANGAGYKNALDTNTNKEFWGYVMLQPFAPWIPVMEKFYIGATVRIPMILKDELDKEVLISPFIGYSHKWFTLGYHPLIKYTKKAPPSDDRVLGIGHGAYFRFDMPWKVGVLAQFNVWDEDRDLESRRNVYEFIGGLSYSPASFLSIAAACFLGWRSKYDDPATLEDESVEEMFVRLLLSTELKF